MNRFHELIGKLQWWLMRAPISESHMYLPYWMLAVKTVVGAGVGEAATILDPTRPAL